MSPAHRPLVIGLTGQPNVGKSTVFNLLTGLDQHVGNWPGKTVERREGICRHGGKTLTVVDLPGTYSLTANSPEERIARDFILHERPDVVIMIANAAALERNLYLLAELLPLRVPVALGLNMMDVAQAEGIEIEPRVLAAALGLPVVPLVANRAQGVAGLLDEALRLAGRPADFKPNRPEIAKPQQQVLASVRAILGAHVPEPYPPDWVATKLLEADAEASTLARSWLPGEAWQKIEAILAAHEDAVNHIAAGRYEVDRPHGARGAETAAPGAGELHRPPGPLRPASPLGPVAAGRLRPGVRPHLPARRPCPDLARPGGDRTLAPSGRRGTGRCAALVVRPGRRRCAGRGGDRGHLPAPPLWV